MADADQPLLTIVTATYNLVSAGREKRFRQCVESVHAQSCLAQIEHLVVDNESNDGTAELLKGYADRGYFKVVSKKDHSVYEGMNNGLAEARGKYIAYLNSDDFLCNRTELARALKELETSGADYCFGDVDVLNPDDSFCTIWKGATDGLPFAHNYCHQSMIVKTELLRSLGGFDLSYKVSSDSDLMLRLYHDGRPYIHSAYKFATYRLGGLSTASRAVSQADHAMAFHKYFGQSAGLTLEQCKGLWDFECAKTGGIEECLELLVKIPEAHWRKAWLEALGPLSRPGSLLAVEPKDEKQANDHLWQRFRNKYRHFGVIGVLSAIGRRLPFAKRRRR